MKPNATNNLSAWGYVGLFILFSMPYIGTPACILFAIFGQGDARSFARALLIIAVIIYVLAFGVILLAFSGLFGIEEILPELLPELLPEDSGVELFRALPSVLG